MRISEMLFAIASWLEDPNNEALLLAEYDDDCLKVVSESCVNAAKVLKEGANNVEKIEPENSLPITVDHVEVLASLANHLDSVGNDDLKKKASVLDEILLTIAANPKLFAEKVAAEDKKIEEIKKKMNKDMESKIADSKKDIEKSKMTSPFQINQNPLVTRYCPDHPGAQISRVSDNVWQCEMDKKKYDFSTGFELMDGTKVPGGDVANQTDKLNYSMDAIFDTRNGRLGQNS